MNENTRITEIKKRLEKNAYFVNPHSDAHVVDDMRYLLDLLEGQEKKLESQLKKNEVLANQLLEMTQEIENVKADFGNNR